MWDETKKAIDIIQKALEKNQDAEDMTITFVMDKDTAIKFGDELCRFINRDSMRRTIRRMTETAKDPDIRSVTCLYDTADLMASKNYKDRFYAEYWQLKIRYEKLKKFNNRIEAANRMVEPQCYPTRELLPQNVEMPKHDCPYDLLRVQQHTMGEYLHLLEVRAVIEGIVLDPEA